MKQKANMLYLSKEATNKDASLKMQLLLSSRNDDKCPMEMIWKHNGFFGDLKGEYTITKANFAKNTLIYVNNGTISNVKGGDYAFYPDYVDIGQLICAKKISKNYECKQDEVKLFVLNYNVKTENFLGVQNWLAYIMLGAMNMKPFCFTGLKKRNQKFYIQQLSNRSQIYFKLLLSKIIT